MGKLFKLEMVNPFDAANEVINRWADEAVRNVGQWAANYENEVRSKAQDPQTLQEAAMKLGLWYSELERDAPAIGEIYARIKKRYKERLQALRRKAPAPARTRTVEVYAQA